MDLCPKNILSLCAGVGGIDLGLRLAEPAARTVCYVEIEAFACELLATRMENQALDDAPIWTDLRTFNGKVWRGKVDCITAGYPCQPFSVAGKQRAEKDPRHLWPEVCRIVQEIQPRICFFENVGGHLRLGFEQVHDDLSRLGYCVKAGLFTAAEVGAPHKRERLFILAYRQSVLCQRALQERDSAEQPQVSVGSKCCHVANADVTGFQKTRPELKPERTCGENGQLGDTKHAGSSTQSQLRGHETASNRRRAEESQASGKSARANRPTHVPSLRGGSKGEQLAHTDCIGAQISPAGKQPAKQEFNLNGYQIFPPAPSDLQMWERVQNSLKPAVCRMADGMANRVDRIRTCGNGVVPLVAAYAWRTLTTRTANGTKV